MSAFEIQEMLSNFVTHFFLYPEIAGRTIDATTEDLCSSFYFRMGA